MDCGFHTILHAIRFHLREQSFNCSWYVLSCTLDMLVTWLVNPEPMNWQNKSCTGDSGKSDLEKRSSMGIDCKQNVELFTALPGYDLISDCSGYGVPWRFAQRVFFKYATLHCNSQKTCTLESCKSGPKSRTSMRKCMGRRTFCVPTEFHAESNVFIPLGVPFAFPCTFYVFWLSLMNP